MSHLSMVSDARSRSLLVCVLVSDSSILRSSPTLMSLEELRVSTTQSVQSAELTADNPHGHLDGAVITGVVRFPSVARAFRFYRALGLAIPRRVDLHRIHECCPTRSKHFRLLLYPSGNLPTYATSVRQPRMAPGGSIVSFKPHAAQPSLSIALSSLQDNEYQVLINSLFLFSRLVGRKTQHRTAPLSAGRETYLPIPRLVLSKGPFEFNINKQNCVYFFFGTKCVFGAGPSGTHIGTTAPPSRPKNH